MPSYRHHELGDLYVRINVTFPPSIEPSVIPLLEQALPQRNAMTKFAKKTHVEEVTLEEPNDRQRKSAASNGDEMDEDEEDGRPGVACQQREFLLCPVRCPWAPWAVGSQKKTEHRLTSRINGCEDLLLSVLTTFRVASIRSIPKFSASTCVPAISSRYRCIKLCLRLVQ